MRMNETLFLSILLILLIVIVTCKKNYKPNINRRSFEGDDDNGDEDEMPYKSDNNIKRSIKSKRKVILPTPKQSITTK